MERKKRLTGGTILPVVLLIIVFLCCIIVVAGMLRQDAEKRMHNLSSYFVMTIDELLLSQENAALDLFRGNVANELQIASIQYGSAPQTKTQGNLLWKDIASFCGTNTLADDVLIYYPSSGYIVGSHGCLDAYKYYKIRYPALENRQDEFETWKDTVLFQEKGRLSYSVDPNTGEIEFYYLLKSPRNVDLEQCDRIMLMYVSKEAVCTMIEKFANALGIERVVFRTETGALYLDWSNTPSVKPLEQTDLSGYVSTSIPSSAWGMEISLLQERSVVYQFVELLVWILTIVTVIAGALALGMAVYSGIYHKRNVKNILAKFQITDTAYAVNEYALILKKIDDLFRENAAKIAELENHMWLIKGSALKEIIYLNIKNERDAESICAGYEVTLENENYALILFDVNLKKVRVSTQEIQTVLQNYQTDSFDILWTGIEDVCVFLCNYSETAEGITMPNALAQELSGVLGSKKYIISNVFYVSGEICPRFKQLYQDLTKHKAVLRQKLDDSISQRFLYAVNCNNIRSARALLPALQKWAESMGKEARSLCKRYEFLSQLYDMPIFRDKHQQLNNLVLDRQAVQWSGILLECLYDNSSAAKGLSSAAVIDAAALIIAQEYANPQLSLSSIAEQLGVSQSHLSRSYKEQYGIGISADINRQRIEQAKNLMLSGSDNLKVIAEAVGFTSEMNFIRVFKKQENTTPGAYRKTAGSAETDA